MIPALFIISLWSKANSKDGICENDTISNPAASSWALGSALFFKGSHKNATVTTRPLGSRSGPEKMPIFLIIIETLYILKLITI